MRNITLVSPIALAFGLALTGAAAAQHMIGTQNVSDADWPAVQEKCDELVAAGTEGEAMFDGDVSSSDENTDVDDGGDNDDSTATPAEPTVEGGFDANLITLEECRAAGLVD